MVISIFSWFRKDNTGIFNLWLLIKSVREVLYLVNIYTFSKNLIVIYSKQMPPNIFTSHAYGFDGRWITGFLTNFKYLIRKEYLRKNNKGLKKLLPK